MGNVFSDIRKSAPFNKNRDNGRKTALGTQTKERNFPASNETAVTAKDNKSQHMKKNEAVVRPNKPMAADTGRARPLNSNIQRKANVEPKMPLKMENSTVPKRPLNAQQDVSKIK
jgi:hypothetical protein